MCTRSRSAWTRVFLSGSPKTTVLGIRVVPREPPSTFPSLPPPTQRPPPFCFLAPALVPSLHSTPLLWHTHGFPFSPPLIRPSGRGETRDARRDPPPTDDRGVRAARGKATGNVNPLAGESATRLPDGLYDATPAPNCARSLTLSVRSIAIDMIDHAIVTYAGDHGGRNAPPTLRS